MSEVLEELINLLRLEDSGNDSFIGQSQDLGFRQLFGGQLLAQSLMAASLTAEGYFSHSLHGYFLQPGDPDLPIQFDVDRIRDGKSFVTRRVVALQNDLEIFTATISFHSEEDGHKHQLEMPQVKPPEELRSELEIRRKFASFIPEKLREKFTKDAPIEIRPVKVYNYMQPKKLPASKDIWLKTVTTLPDDQVLHRCILAYASDFGLLGTSLNPHAIHGMMSGIQLASLDHALWFHHDVKIDDWLLYSMDSPSASNGLGFNRGSVFSRDGLLMASVAQEALIRDKNTFKKKTL
ncbi:acyl-CoA thioesterase II [Gammaproteobacteria bacterium 45_16_T64]|nr:acyl-CoA thioesterase II [Gammaproteobacteria bacterium 45_16_T64]